MIVDGLWDVYNQYHMGVTAENVAKEYGVTREEQDEFAVASQNKAEAAQKAGRFKDEIVPVEIPQRKGEPLVFADRRISRATARRSKRSPGLKPAFDKNGTVTAGNASGINDGAAAVVVMSAKKAKELGLKPLAQHQGLRLRRRRSEDHGHGAGAGLASAAWRRPAGRRRTST